MFVNHWVSGSQPSLDIHEANNTLPFSGLLSSCSQLPNCRKCDWPSDTRAGAHTKRVLIQERAPVRVEDTDPLSEQAPRDRGRVYTPLPARSL